MTNQTQPDLSNLAVASLVLGILSLAGAGPLTGIPAIVTGIMALKSPSGRGMAIAGIITGSVSILLALLILLFFVSLIVLGIFAASSYEQAPTGPVDLYDQGGYQQRA